MVMAKRNYKSKKIEPSVLKLFLSVPAGEQGLDTSYIDLSQCASLVNRRFYRQGINWAVKSMRIVSFTGDANSTIIFSKLPNTWVMSNAWEKSFRAWQQMIKNATDESGQQSIRGKFLDFKVFADAEHHASGINNNLIPYSGTVNSSQYTRGPWEAATIMIPDTNQPFNIATATPFELIAVGPNDPGAGASGMDAKSVIQGYADSRALPSITDPNVPADASSNWMLDLFNDGNEQDSDVTAMLEIYGDQPPYPFENDGTNPDTMYPAGETQAPQLEHHHMMIFTGTNNTGVLNYTVPGGNFPCGLIRIDAVTGQQNFSLELELVPGHHRGYLCEPMTDM